MRLRAKHYWRKHLAGEVSQRLATIVCDPTATLGMLSAAPQGALTCLDRFIAFLTTPFKRLGIDGWKETGCRAEGQGSPVRDAQHSTDGFWTIDIRLAALAIGQSPADLSAARYLRLEVEPETAAHEVCAGNSIGPRTQLSFGGAVVIDTDGPFLEVHPEEDFRIV